VEACIPNYSFVVVVGGIYFIPEKLFATNLILKFSRVEKKEIALF